MSKMMAPVATLLVLVAGVALAADTKSGLQIGEAPGFFQVKDISGPNTGDTLCYRCAYGNRPVVTVFTRRMGDDVTQLVKQIDQTVGKNQDSQMKALVVYLSDDPDSAEAKLKDTAKKLGLSANTPLTVFQTSEGPDNYKISKDAEITVLMWTNSKVKANHAFAKGATLSNDDIKKIVADTTKILK